MVRNTFVGRVPGFAGFTGNGSSSGGNGVSLVDDATELWSGGGDSTVKVIDLKTNKIVDTISTGGKKRASQGRQLSRSAHPARACSRL